MPPYGGNLTEWRNYFEYQWRKVRLKIRLTEEERVELDRYGKVIPETSKIADDLTLYCTRHTFCTEVVGVKGIDASRAIFITGHANAASLANYLHRTEAVVQSIAQDLYPQRQPAPEYDANAAEA